VKLSTASIGRLVEQQMMGEGGEADQTAGDRDVGHGVVRAEEPGETGDMMARSDSDSADDEAEDERAILVPVKPMPQWRPHRQVMRHRDG
jgi:hypothetical protein